MFPYSNLFRRDLYFKIPGFAGIFRLLIYEFASERNTDDKTNPGDIGETSRPENRQVIIEANMIDVAACPPDNVVIFDRLKLDDAKIEKMIASVSKVIEASDPVGKIISTHNRENGLRIENRSVPFGTILIIYEARPDVLIEAAMICQKENIETWIVGGGRSNFLVDAIEGSIPFTKFSTRSVS